jgi:hypothetical protein
MYLHIAGSVCDMPKCPTARSHINIVNASEAMYRHGGVSAHIFDYVLQTILTQINGLIDELCRYEITTNVNKTLTI